MVLEFLNGKPLTELHRERPASCRTRARSSSWCAILRALAVRARAGHRPPRPQARQHLRHRVRHHQGARLRHRQGAAAAAGRRGAADVGRSIRMPSPLELATGTNTSLTRVGTIMGTLKYMSPEQWGIGIEIDHLTDIWACGILLYRMICGRHPLHPLDGNQLVVTAMLELPMPSMHEAAPPDVPRELIQIVDRCLLKHQGAALAERAASCSRARAVPARPPHARAPDRREPVRRAVVVPGERRRQVLRPQPRDRGDGDADPRPAADGGRRQLGRRQVVVRPRRPRARAQALGRDLGDARHPPRPQAARGARQRDRSRWSRPRRTSPTRWTSRRSSSRRCARSRATSATCCAAARAATAGGILLFVDQFEELYTQVADADGARRVHRVPVGGRRRRDQPAARRAVDPLGLPRPRRRGPAVPGRADAGPVLPRPAEPRRPARRDRRSPPRWPATSSRRPAIVEDMLDHLETTPGALPLLQFAASKLWDARDTARKLLTHRALPGDGRRRRRAREPRRPRGRRSSAPQKQRADPRGPAAPGHARAHARDRADGRAARAVARGRRGPAPRRSDGRRAPARRPDRSRAARARRSRSSTSR